MLTVPSLMKGLATCAIFCLEFATLCKYMVPVGRVKVQASIKGSGLEREIEGGRERTINRA